MEHNSENSRIISVTLRGKHKNFKVIQVYAPDSSYEDENVKNFYSKLEEEVETTKTGDVVMVMGDFNSKIGNDRTGYEDVKGEFGLGGSNERVQGIELFTVVDRLTRAWKNNEIALRDTDGNKVSATAGVEKIWKTHYEEQLKGIGRQVTGEDYPELSGELWNIQETPDLLIEEVEKALGAMSSGKARGIDGLPKELLEAGGEMVERWLCDLCKAIVDGHAAPNDWIENIIISTHKKGDTTLCKIIGLSVYYYMLIRS
ncbi:uncharacterized protein [Palaemon carinicauda]|uniref:uncharacterized protein n=1 Tax=Palaemon carinicauda TaxID=392227 RepID=UPI0035B63570